MATGNKGQDQDIVCSLLYRSPALWVVVERATWKHEGMGFNKAFKKPEWAGELSVFFLVSDDCSNNDHVWSSSYVIWWQSELFSNHISNEFHWALLPYQRHYSFDQARQLPCLRKQEVNYFILVEFNMLWRLPNRSNSSRFTLLYDSNVHLARFDMERCLLTWSSSKLVLWICANVSGLFSATQIQLQMRWPLAARLYRVDMTKGRRAVTSACNQHAQMLYNMYAVLPANQSDLFLVQIIPCLFRSESVKRMFHGTKVV